MHSVSNAGTPRGTPARRGKSPRFSADNHSPAPSTFLPTTFPKPGTSFTTSLSIPVEGAVPIETPVDKITPPLPVQQPSMADTSKRAPRKSKTDALAALHSHAQSSDREDAMGNDIDAEYRSAPKIPVSPTLNLNTVRTSAPRNIPTPPQPRPFGLQDCPVFYPTDEEFMDPMAYIRSVQGRAKGFGICKVVPPVNWKMPFVTDTENFRFKTRLQRLNSVEASSRAKINYLEQLYRYHQQQGNSRVSVPSINNKALDLWLLRKEVHRLGGHEAVTKLRKWSDLGRILGYGGIPGLSTQIKGAYMRIVKPYEDFCARVRTSPSMSPGQDPLKASTSNPIPLGSTSRTPDESGYGSGLSSPLTESSSPLSEPPDDGEEGNASGSKPRRSTRMPSQEQTTPASRKPISSNGNGLLPSPSIVSHAHIEARKDAKVPSEVRSRLLTDSPSTPAARVTKREQQNCEVCHKKNHGEEMLLCDGCDCGFHMFCLDPPLTTIPKGQWFCHTCLFGTGGDYGFDEGEEHSLSSFQARDREFRRLWFNAHPPPPIPEAELQSPTVTRVGDVQVSEYQIEEEFWRLVQSPHETVEIEYGADVHSTTHGSAMPTMETHPLDPYAKDPWNLNNIPIVSDSLLRFIKSDISGMTVPWTYVGMVFSTFCWHNEDHYTYSVNYMHWGDTKTWYGVPGEDAEQFEAAIKREAPDLFEAQPDLLFQLVTLMNPKRLTDAGVRVFACNQRAGEFVITLPKAYHAGFNHGFNFNEAVNFALSEWLPFGRDCVERYREHRKLPVFSHDELLITITQQSQSIKTALWLNDSLKEMTDREMASRQTARSLGLAEHLEEEDRAEDQYQCSVCKTFCYLSQVTCQCTTKVVCIDHVDLLCDHPSGQHVLRKRFSDRDLLDTQAKVAERAGVPRSWQTKFENALAESARPPLRTLRALLAEGERISHPLTELASLRKCVDRAVKWVDAANVFIIRKNIRKRSRRARGRPSLNADDPEEKQDRSLDDLYALLREVENLGFDCPEIALLRQVAAEAEEVKSRARRLLALVDSNGIPDRAARVEECQAVLAQGLDLNVSLDELQEVEKIVNRETLLYDLDDFDDTNVTLDEIRELITRARACSLPPDHPHMKFLEEKGRAADNWEDRAQRVLAQPYKTIDELDDFANMDPKIPIDPDVLDDLMTARSKAKEFEKQAQAWMVAEPGTTKPKLQDALKLISRAEKDFSIPAVSDLKRTAEFGHDLEQRCEAVLTNRYQHREEGNVFDIFQRWRAYAREHLTMFSLPNFEKFDDQLSRHYKWLEEIPWYCRHHQQTHGQQIYDDVVECTKPEDDSPPSDEYFTCICTQPVRPPPPGTVSDAVQCDHCFARFHGICAANGGSCPFCDHHHWNGAIHKERSWHFCFLPALLTKAPDISKHYSEDWKQLETIVHRLDRLSAVIGQFLSYASQPGNQRVEWIPQVRHYLRKLYKIQFAISPNREVSFGLDLAGLHRILAGQPAPSKSKKRRRPRFIFGQDVDKDWADGTRCICRGRTSYLLNYPTVKCELCAHRYHAGCVFFPLDQPSAASRFMCPLCSLRKNRQYPYSEVRVKHVENPDPDKYVDTKEMLETFSKEVVYMKLPPPYTQTLFVELIRFTPGQPDNAAANGTNGASSSARSSTSTASRQPAPSGASPHARHSHAPSTHAPPPPPVPGVFDANRSATVATGQHVPPPPPWSRWSNGVASPSASALTGPRPPTTDQGLATPPLAQRKRKYVDDDPADNAVASSHSPKRRSVPRTPPVPAAGPSGSSGHAMQTVSPSLASLLSPSVDARPVRAPPTTMPNGSESRRN
ncbi:hypothetical protein PLICRDRAFT_149931 [Plicaturopsis crispa FD-325 SS-3]|nr:hypothetical protein PLICRDRAFT_149931 [Plicaturopsis crispa FD-325 SS-3]